MDLAGQIFHHACQRDGLRRGALQPSRPSILFESFGQGTVPLLMVETVFMPRVGTSQGRHFFVVQDVVHDVGGDGGRGLFFDVLNDGGAAARAADRPHFNSFEMPVGGEVSIYKSLIFLFTRTPKGVLFGPLLVLSHDPLSTTPPFHGLLRLKAFVKWFHVTLE